MYKGFIFQKKLSPESDKSYEKKDNIWNISPIEHELLESFQWHSRDQALFLCRERCSRPSAPGVPEAGWTIERAREFCSAHDRWPLDYVAIAIDCRSGDVSFTAGHGGVTPLYIRVTDAGIALSWSVADFYKDLSVEDISREAMGLRLLGTPPYAARTLFRSVYMLTERATVHVSRAGTVRVQYPSPATYYIPTPIHEGADIPAAACGLVEALLERWSWEAPTIASEFSGGLDSAVVAALLSRRHPGDLPTYALQIEGPAERQQTLRRALAIDHFGFKDSTVPVGIVPMVPPTLHRQADYEATPYNADLQRPLRRLLKTFRTASGSSVVATGTGGDELLMPHAFEQEAEQLARNVNDAFLPRVLPPAFTPFLRENIAEYALACDRAPFSVVPISILEAQAARAPLFALYGFWPVSPFAQPEAVRFYRSLPLAWRQNKFLHRRLLQFLGYPDGFLNIPERENFEVYLGRSLVAGATGIVRDLHQECRLHELGILDAERLISAFQALRPESDLGDIGFLFHAFNMEYMLRRLGED